jgi:hypothetical protein
MKLNLFYLISFCLIGTNLLAQEKDRLRGEVLDSLYILEIEKRQGKAKILHAEPLYIDLIRDLGARKGEKEWNVGMGLTDNLSYDTYEALIEYEWAPIDRVGLEVELPFTFYGSQANTTRDSLPSNSLESIKMAAQWTFLVDEPTNVSMALGYIHEFELNSFRDWGKPMFKGLLYNPFLIAAKRWGQNWHTLIYTGPRFEQQFTRNEVELGYEFHTNLHYMVPGTRNFIGVEVNKYLENNDFDMTIRPQMRLGISDQLMLGIVGGIPVSRENERLSLFLRLIWEPEHSFLPNLNFFSGSPARKAQRHRHTMP